MAKMYARMVERGAITINDVPEKYLAEVKAILGIE